MSGLPPDLAHRLWDQRPGAKRVLARLMQTPGKAVSKATLRVVAGVERRPSTDNAVNAHVCRLRKAIPAEIGRIETVFRTTYRWVPA